MSKLDINSKRGQKSLDYEREMLGVLKKKLGF